ncbi:CheY-like chemotaxis protein [Rhodobium orientis]|uniref:response regulator n=1 Tax=Rhodobium orientis TaxID=34017 RepID=UPI0017DDB63D|nr:response regulator [Rhodobium orientis]MBB4303161.1 CheY-like chemotaxis protein [Rhodobium orientis]
MDDDPDIREITVMSLELDEDLEVQSCECGQDALKVAREWQPDLILLDVMMPEMDGPQTLAALQEIEETKDIPVIFITARTQHYEVERFMQLGAADVIAKPFDPEALADLVTQHIQKRAS